MKKSSEKAKIHRKNGLRPVIRKFTYRINYPIANISARTRDLVWSHTLPLWEYPASTSSQLIDSTARLNFSQPIFRSLIGFHLYLLHFPGADTKRYITQRYVTKRQSATKRYIVIKKVMLQNVTIQNGTVIIQNCALQNSTQTLWYVT